MLSRVRNYLEDQLLGFALVPLSQVLIKNGKLEKEFSLSSTDLFHSPAGFVQLSLSYSGASPEVMALPTSVATNAVVQDSEIPESSEFEKLEFPDPKIVNENHQMVSEYFGIPCDNLDSQSSESFVSSDTENQLSSEIGVHVVESFSTGTIDSIQLLKHDSPPSSVSTNGSPSASLPASSQSCDTPNQEYVSPPKENLKERREDVGDAESGASGGVSGNAFAKPVVSVNIEPEQKVVQQEIVDMYMKSMQQFTESLAKMKLPMDIGSGPTNSPTNSGNSSSDQKLQASKSTGSRVFYGSRAFF
uniref:Putative Calcium-dependent lipid-binding family protein isoform 1 n=1 Tax=Davidia involucrata TaxID=16924 RepID=A0A5B6YKT2_DAVIN